MDSGDRYCLIAEGELGGELSGVFCGMLSKRRNYQIIYFCEFYHIRSKYKNRRLLLCYIESNGENRDVVPHLGVHTVIFPHCNGKRRIFRAGIIVSTGEAWPPRIEKMGRARQITNGVSSDDTAAVPRDIMPFLESI